MRLQTKTRLGKTFFAFALAAAACAASRPGHATGVPLFFLDGGRRVDIERTGPAACDARGRVLTPVRLAYPGRPDVHAAVDHSAIVEIEPGAEAMVEARGVRLIRPLMPSIGIWLAEDAGGGDGIDAARRLAGEDARALGVREAIPNLYLQTVAHGVPHTPNDPRFPGQWYFANLKMQDAWGITLGDPTMTIVVIDGGCDLQHPDLAAKLDPGIDVISGDSDPSYDPTSSQPAHGTACAGLAAASTDNSEGIAGACPECRLRCVRMVSDTPIPISAEIEAFQFALDVGAAVVSNSWGFKYPTPVPQALADAIHNVFQNGRSGKGALVLFSAGNDDRVIGDDEIQAAAGVLCIGAITHFDDHTSFTNSGNAIDLVAPTGTLTTDISGSAGDDPGDYMSLFGGTSSACPVVSGIAGLLVSAAPDRTSAELYDVLIKTARPAPYAVPDAMGHDQVFGYGIVDPVNALHDVLGIVEPPDGGPSGSSGSGTTPKGSAPADGVSACGCSIPGDAAGGLRGMALFCAAAITLARVRRRLRGSEPI